MGLFGFGKKKRQSEEAAEAAAEEHDKDDEAISETAKELDICIVGGHTGWYDAVTIPTVGGVTVWGFAPADQWVSPGGAQP